METVSDTKLPGPFFFFLVRGGNCEIIGLEGGFKECLVYIFIKNKGFGAYGFLFFQNYMLPVGMAACNGQ